MNENNLRPKTLDQFVGQSRVKEILRIAIQAARIRGAALPHILLIGGPGLGKTSLSYALANELGAGITVSSGPMLDRGLIKTVRSMKRGQLLFVDEIHSIGRDVAEKLYPVLEDFELHLSFGSTIQRIPLERFCFIGATTRPADLPAPLRSRFNLVLHLDPYTVEELAVVVKRSAGILGIPINDDGALEIARRSRSNPRIANSHLRLARDFSEARGLRTVTIEAVRGALGAYGIDSHGLDGVDRAILRTLRTAGRAIGISALAASVAESEETIEMMHEPFLLQQGFLCRTQRGRVATQLAHVALGN